MYIYVYVYINNCILAAVYRNVGEVISKILCTQSTMDDKLKCLETI